jgi:hypothetical protein
MRRVGQSEQLLLFLWLIQPWQSVSPPTRSHFETQSPKSDGVGAFAERNILKP